tara:strand:- start:40279 stop:40707 length:429 start_codon:yes stop_codon:yes gene_type:complete
MSVNKGTPSGEESYEVGYGKPPKEHQFQKGNKLGKGQKKGAKALKTIVKEVSGQKLQVKLRGKTKKLTMLELAIQQLFSKASKGDLNATAKMIALTEMYLPQDEAGERDAETQKADMDALRDFIALQDQLEAAEEDEEDQGD